MRLLATNRQALISDLRSAVVTYYIDGAYALTDEFMIALKSSPEPPLLFAHGFNNNVAKATITADLIQASVPSRQIVLWSWANRSDVFDYAHDETLARQGAPQLLSLLKLLGPVDMIAHSMGNRMFRWAITADKSVSVKSFASVEADDGRDAPALIAPQITKGGCWWGKRDGALQASMIEHAAERLGLQGPREPIADKWESHELTDLMSLDPLEAISNHSLPFKLPEFYRQYNTFLEAPAPLPPTLSPISPA